MTEWPEEIRQVSAKAQRGLAPDWVYMDVILGVGEADAPWSGTFRILRLFVYFGYAASHDAF